MNVQRIAAFADGNSGGNPAGVVILDTLPDPDTMQSVAADIAYSETVFAAPRENGWQVRYFHRQQKLRFTATPLSPRALHYAGSTAITF